MFSFPFIFFQGPEGPVGSAGPIGEKGNTVSTKDINFYFLHST